jgi:Gametolysin peptidase M11
MLLCDLPPPAFLGGNIAIFNDHWCNYPSIQMHEIGHNLRLQHAGETGEGDYEDRVGMMGVSFESESTLACFNTANAWQLGWYGRSRKALDFSKDPGFRGQVIGLVDYEHPAAGGSLVTIRASSSTSSTLVYVGFNRKAGFNADTDDGANQVVVTTQKDEGPSTLVGKLNAGQSYRLANFQGSQGLNVKVNSINFGANPPLADVEVYLDSCPAGSTSRTCNACAASTDCAPGHGCAIASCNAGTCSYDTSSCPGTFAVSLRTDSWGTETTWELVNTCTGSVAMRGGPYGTNQQHDVSNVIGLEPHKLTLYDSQGDGFESQGLFRATMDGLEVARVSGNFISSENFFFGTGACGGAPAPAPVPEPVPAPVPEPVPAPVPEPVPAPVPVPDPTTGVTVGTPQVVFVASEPSSLLGVCEGDCGTCGLGKGMKVVLQRRFDSHNSFFLVDADTDCGPGLSCFQRTGLEEVPGCSGSTTVHGGWDLYVCSCHFYFPAFSS